MNPQILFWIGGGACLIFLLVALDLSRIIRARSGDWQQLQARAENETSPLMEVEVEVRPTAPAIPGKVQQIKLPQAPEIIDQIVTHTDWDGILCGALIRNFSPLARIEVVATRGLRKALVGMARTADKPHRLFVTDIGIESSVLPDIESALIDIKKAGTKVYWYDHHPWSSLSVDTARRDCQDLIVDPHFRNAAEIVYARITAGNDYADKLIRLLTNRLLPEEKEWGSTWRLLIQATQSSGTFGDIVDVIINLGANRSLSVSDKFKVARMSEEEKIYQRFAEGQHRQETTKSGLKFLVVDLRTLRMEYDEKGKLKRKIDRHTPPASIGHDIVKYHKPDFYLMVLKNDRLSIRTGEREKFRLGNLQQLKVIKGNPVQISGHQYAAGVYLTIGFKSKITRLWNWSLPPEVEDFIQEVKDRV